MDMKALHVQNRTIAIIENGSWAPKSGDLMTKFCDEDLKQMTIINEQVSLLSMAGENSYASLDNLVKAVAKDLKNEGEAIDEKSAPKPAAKAKAPAKAKAKAKAKK
jgi:pantothenate kinase